MSSEACRYEPDQDQILYVHNLSDSSILFCALPSESKILLSVDEALNAENKRLMIYNWINGNDSLAINISDPRVYGYKINGGISAITFTREVMEQYTRQEIIEQDLYLNKYYFTYDELKAADFKIYIGDEKIDN